MATSNSTFNDNKSKETRARPTDGGVRLGGGDSGGKQKIFIAAGAAAILIVAIVVIVGLSGKEQAVSAPVGCQRDTDCDNGGFCAKGGCIVLMSSEHRGLWRDAIAAQNAPGSTWRADKEAGERMVADTLCPLPLKAVPEPKLDRIRIEAVARFIEVGCDRLRVHQQQKVKGEVWVDVIRFELDPLASADPSTACGTENVSGLRMTEGALGKPAADVLLQTAVPAGKSVSAGISFLGPSPEIGADGQATLRLPLLPSSQPGIRQHTIVAFPLGTDIFSISGPKPARQKLIKGYVLYDFNHAESPSVAVFEYRCNANSTHGLDLTGEPLQVMP